MGPRQLKRLREAAKLNRSELAELLKVSPSTITRWENGERLIREGYAEYIRMKLKERAA